MQDISYLLLILFSSILFKLYNKAFDIIKTLSYKKNYIILIDKNTLTIYYIIIDLALKENEELSTCFDKLNLQNKYVLYTHVHIYTYISFINFDQL